MTPHVSVLSRQDRLIEELRSKTGSPLADYADLFAGILGSFPVVSEPRDALRKYVRVIRKMLLTSDGDLIMSRYAYKNIRRAFYVLLFMPLDRMPSFLSSYSSYDPIPFFAAWRLAEGV